MPLPGLRWRHAVISTKNTWFKGDPRGFRAKHHEIHSSGDYKDPPPPGEHAGLLCYFKRRAGAEVQIEHDWRPTLGRALIECLRNDGRRVYSVAVTKVH